jgi:uncharacterized protein DUF732
VDYDDYEPTRRLTPRRVTDAAWGVVEPVPTPAAPAPVPVVTPTTSAAPTATVVHMQPGPWITLTKPVTVTVPAPPPKTVVAPPPTGITPDQVAVYDPRFVNQMAAAGSTTTSAEQMAHKAHEVCGLFQQGYSPQFVNQKLVDENGISPDGALLFTSTAMLTYPSCP